MYVKLPIKFKEYFCNTFYSSFPTSDLVESEYQETSKERHWINIEKNARFKDISDYQKDGNYLDPMVDILSMFQNVPSQTTLNIFFDYTFKIEESARKQTRETFKKILKRARATSEKKEEKTEDKTKKEDQIYFSLSYSIKTDNSVTADAIESNLLSVFAPLVTK